MFCSTIELLSVSAYVSGSIEQFSTFGQLYVYIYIIHVCTIVGSCFFFSLASYDNLPFEEYTPLSQIDRHGVTLTYAKELRNGDFKCFPSRFIKLIFHTSAELEKQTTSSSVFEMKSLSATAKRDIKKEKKK